MVVSGHGVLTGHGGRAAAAVPRLVRPVLLTVLRWIVSPADFTWLATNPILLQERLLLSLVLTKLQNWSIRWKRCRMPLLTAWLCRSTILSTIIWLRWTMRMAQRSSLLTASLTLKVQWRRYSPRNRLSSTTLSNRMLLISMVCWMAIMWNM